MITTAPGRSPSGVENEIAEKAEIMNESTTSSLQRTRKRACGMRKTKNFVTVELFRASVLYQTALEVALPRRGVRWTIERNHFRKLTIE